MGRIRRLRPVGFVRFTNLLNQRECINVVASKLWLQVGSREHSYLYSCRSINNLEHLVIFGLLTNDHDNTLASPKDDSSRGQIQLNTGVLSQQQASTMQHISLCKWKKECRTKLLIGLHQGFVPHYHSTTIRQDCQATLVLNKIALPGAWPRDGHRPHIKARKSIC